MPCFPDDVRFRMTYASYKPGKSDGLYVDAHIWQRSGLREDIAEHPASSRRRAAASAEYNSGRRAFSRGGIVIPLNWKRSLPVSELGSKDKLNTSGHPIKHPGKFPFWYPFGHVSFIKEHSGWNEIKGFLLCFVFFIYLSFATIWSPALWRYDGASLLKKHSVCLTILITFPIRHDRKLFQSP